MSRRVLNSFRVPAISSLFERNGQKFQPEALLKKKQVSFARLACLYVLVCVLQNENLEGEHRRRPWVNSNSFSNEKNFLRSLNLLRETWKRSTFLGRMSLSCKARMIVLFQEGPGARNF